MLKRMKKERERFGVWQFWLTKSLLGFAPIVPRVAAKLGITQTQLVRDAVLTHLAKHDAEAARLLKDWKSIYED